MQHKVTIIQDNNEYTNQHKSWKVYFSVSLSHQLTSGTFSNLNTQTCYKLIAELSASVSVTIMLKFEVTIGCLRSNKSFDHAGVPYQDMALPYQDMARGSVRTCHYTGYRHAGTFEPPTYRGTILYTYTGLSNHQWLLHVPCCPCRIWSASTRDLLAPHVCVRASSFFFLGIKLLCIVGYINNSSMLVLSLRLILGPGPQNRQGPWCWWWWEDQLGGDGLNGIHGGTW